MAGTSQCCNHVIATLYKIDCALRQGYLDPLCTSVPCSWNKSSKREVKAKQIKEIVVRKRIRSKEKDKPSREEVRKDELSNFNPILPAYREKTSEEVSVLFENLHEVTPESAIFLCIPVHDSTADMESFILQNVANQVIEDPGNDTNDKKISRFLQSLPVSSQGIKLIEKKTRGQAENDLWMNLRKGRLTGSNHHDIYTKMHSIIKCTGAIKPKTTPLIQKIIYRDNDISHIPAINWGRQHEDQAVKEFFIKKEKYHEDLKIQKCGLFVDAKKAYIAASPDGLVNCKCHGLAALEVKCPYNLRGMVINELSIQNCAFLALNEKKTVSLKRTHKYYTQVVSQMALTGA